MLYGNGINISNIAGANVSGTVANANYAAYAGNVVNASQSNITSVGTLTSLSVTGDITSDTGNITAGNIGNATTMLYGNGINISNIAGANVSGTVANANYAAYAGNVVNASQSNITSVGTLTSLSVTGDITSDTGNITAGNIGNATTMLYGNGINISNIAGANVSGNVANANLAGYVTQSAQSNITSVGTLTGLTSTGTIDLTGASNVSLGAVGNVKITGGSDGQYLVANGSSGGLKWATVDAAQISNGTSNVDIATVNGDITLNVAGTQIIDVSGTGANVTGILNVSGNLVANNITSNVTLLINGSNVANSSITGALQVAGGISAQGNIYAGQAVGFAGNGAGNTSSAAYIQFNSTAHSLDFIFN